jgi:hypothetical protein
MLMIHIFYRYRTNCCSFFQFNLMTIHCLQNDILFISIPQHIISQNPDPRNDPSHVQQCMVYKMGQEVISYFTTWCQ